MIVFLNLGTFIRMGASLSVIVLTSAFALGFLIGQSAAPFPEKTAQTQPEQKPKEKSTMDLFKVSTT